ncbi:hypothetical protein SUDANB6_05771 [Streptomyces sp. enrichment culture]|uniref:cupin domain-containing protein n=1 Tax=Streptomyces sp. enrichment culture TaxID=1795815 RepID=UPI003F5526B7
MTISLNAGSPSSAEPEGKKEPAPLAATPLGGSTQTRDRRILTSDDGRIAGGTGRCEPGGSAWDLTDRGEILHAPSGRTTCEKKDGTAAEADPGTTAVSPIGRREAWTIHETLRKVFVIHRWGSSTVHR